MFSWNHAGRKSTSTQTRLRRTKPGDDGNASWRLSQAEPVKSLHKRSASSLSVANEMMLLETEPNPYTVALIMERRP